MPTERKTKKGKWGYRFTQAGICYKKYAWETRAEAREAEIQFRADLKKNPPLPATALVNVVRDYLIDSADPGRGRSMWRIEALRLSIRKHILSHFGEAKLVDEITEREIEELILKLKRQGLKPKSVWHVLTDLRATLFYAIKRGFLRDNPAKDFRKKWGSLIGSTKSVKPPMDMAEIDRASEAIKHPVDRAWFDVTRFTGMRKDEANRLQWDDIDFDRSMIHYPGTKTEDSDAWLPLAPVAIRTLKELRKQSDLSCPWVFPGRSYKGKGQKVYSRRRLFEAIERVTGIHLKAKDLRDYFASEVASKVNDPAVVMKLLRHTNMTTTTRYLRTVENRMRDAVKDLGGDSRYDNGYDSGATSGGNFECLKVSTTANAGVDEEALELAKILIEQGFYDRHENELKNVPVAQRHGDRQEPKRLVPQSFT
jgi:integrase